MAGISASSLWLKFKLKGGRGEKGGRRRRRGREFLICESIGRLLHRGGCLEGRIEKKQELMIFRPKIEPNLNRQQARIEDCGVGEKTSATQMHNQP